MMGEIDYVDNGKDRISVGAELIYMKKNLECANINMQTSCIKYCSFLSFQGTIVVIFGFLQERL